MAIPGDLDVDVLDDLGLIDTHDLDDPAEYEFEPVQRPEELHSELENVELMLENFLSSLCVAYESLTGSWS